MTSATYRLPAVSRASPPGWLNSPCPSPAWPRASSTGSDWSGGRGGGGAGSRGRPLGRRRRNDGRSPRVLLGEVGDHAQPPQPVLRGGGCPGRVPVAEVLPPGLPGAGPEEAGDEPVQEAWCDVKVDAPDHASSGYSLVGVELWVPPAQREADGVVVVRSERLHRLFVRGEKQDYGALRRLEARPRVGVGQVRVVAQVPCPGLDPAVYDHRKAIAEAGVAAGGVDALDYVRHVR